MPPAPLYPGHAVRSCPRCKARGFNRTNYGDPLGVTPPGDPRLPWEPIARHIDATAGRRLTTTKHAEYIGHDEAQVYRWRQTGLRLHDADRLATRLGVHPVELWGDEYLAPGFHLCPVANADELEAVAA